MGLSKFFAQFTADMVIDLIDKFMSFVLAFLFLKFMPKRIAERMPLGYLYKHQDMPEPAACKENKHPKFLLKVSLKTEIVLIIAVTSLVIGTIATIISSGIYIATTTRKYEVYANDVTELMCHTIDADTVNDYLASGVETEEYLAAETELAQMKDCFAEILYMYVYQIREDGCHVVFDVDTPELPGGALGDVLPYDDAFLDKIPTLLAGGEIDPVIAKGSFGWLLTVYKPLIDSKGECVGYAATDIAMDGVIADRYEYVSRMVALLFGAAIVLILFAVMFAERRLVEPINAMTRAAEEFAYDSEEQRLLSFAKIKQLNIKTGDEVELLYHALDQTVTDVAAYIGDINAKAELIARMQDNIILAFANMVENRDVSTGMHIKRTMTYVKLIAEELKREGLYADTLSNDYIDKLVRSAPLHDMGKIKIPDTLLNKPGRLTAEEFEIMKTHTTEGRTILVNAMEGIGSTGYLQVASTMAAYHHERWNGKGYPEGLCGEQIPLCARIMAVADVFDALISKRCYKEAFPFDEAMAIIADGAGTQFDPTVVQAFVRVSDEVFKML